MLVAGKTIAQTFHVNGATRLHPVEWSCGIAAGIASTMLVNNQWSSSDLYQNGIEDLQNAIVAYGSPIDWTL